MKIRKAEREALVKLIREFCDDDAIADYEAVVAACGDGGKRVYVLANEIKRHMIEKFGTPDRGDMKKMLTWWGEQFGTEMRAIRIRIAAQRVRQ